DKGYRPFDRLTQFGGPMFGVFNKEEMDSIDHWLDWRIATQSVSVGSPFVSNFAPMPEYNSTTEGGLAIPPCSERVTAPVSWNRRTANLVRWLTDALPWHDRCHNRQLFHLLIQPDLTMDTLDQARLRVERVLKSAHRSTHGKNLFNPRGFDYSPAKFAQQIVQIHSQEIAKYKPLNAKPTLRREEYMWGIRQFAPAILVDGSWLQHLGEATNQDRRIQRLLFRIYAEELGEGIIDWNHPCIYRKLLEDLSIELPAVDSLEFAMHENFVDSAFDLPSYLLAISHFPRTYLPEILGLNLAIELSGLGGVYMRLAEELRFWKIDPLIISLHLAIDNLAGGHAAMACEAIQSYMDEVLNLGGTDMAENLWKRIGSGYRSLFTVTRAFKLALLMGFLKEFMPQRVVSLLSNLGK
ncbi:MAG: iron-containing redox enzyme family protein, partial [Candidatus Methylumidiphilus sp.]